MYLFIHDFKEFVDNTGIRPLIHISKSDGALIKASLNDLELRIKDEDNKEVAFLTLTEAANYFETNGIFNFEVKKKN